MPERLHGGDVGRAGESQIDETTQSLGAVAEPVLEDGHEPPRCCLLEFDEAVDLGQGSGQRLLAHHMPTGFECGLGHGKCVVGGVVMSITSMSSIASSSSNDVTAASTEHHRRTLSMLSRERSHTATISNRSPRLR